MGLWAALFGAAYDPESIPSGPVAALPAALANFSSTGPVVARFWYSPDPRYADDLASVHRAMVRCERDAPFARRHSGAQMSRRGGLSLRVPPQVSGPVPMWVRDVAVRGSEFPADLTRSLLPTPFWLRFDSPRNVRLDVVPAASPQGRARQRIDRIRKRGGIAVRAALIQANAALFAPGSDDLPCLVLFSFDERVDEEELRTIAGRVFALKNTTPKEPDLASIAGLTTDEVFVYSGRDLLPRVLAGRRELYVAHLNVHRPFLRSRYLDGELLDCIAEPGNRGMIELLPFNPNA